MKGPCWLGDANFTARIIGMHAGVKNPSELGSIYIKYPFSTAGN